MKDLVPRIGLLVALFALLLMPCRAQVSTSAPEKEDPVLLQKLTDLVRGFHGDVGVYVRNLNTGQSAAIRADELFPTASMIKVTILLNIFDKIDKGELDYFMPLTYRDSLLYPGGGILGSFKDSTEIPMGEVIMLMITMSDNTAALWLQALGGTGVAINEWLEGHGYHSTRMNSRTPGRHGDWEKYGWGQTTPREMAGLLTMIREGRAVSPAASQEMYRILSRVYWDGQSLSQIPPTIQVASKQGAVDESRSEVVLVNAPSGDYVFCVITKNQADTSWGISNEGFTLLRNVSHLLWTYFEPESHWQPAEGMEKFW